MNVGDLFSWSAFMGPAPCQLVLPPPDAGFSRLSRSGCFPPLGLLSIATYVQHTLGTKVDVLDGELLAIDEIEASLQKGVVGLSPTQITYENTLRLARTAKDLGCVVVMGGHHATALGERILLNRPEVDAVVVGDGEEAFVALLRGDPLDAIPNLIYRNADGAATRTAAVPMMTFDRLPWPDRSLLMLPQYFEAFTRQNPNKPFQRPFSLFTQKGCGWRDRSGGCSFCARTDKGWRARTPAQVWGEVRYLVESYGADYIWELSDDILSDEAWFKAWVISRPADLTPAFLCYARPARVTAVTADLFAELGAYEVFLGVESGDDMLLRLCNKGSLSSSNLRAARLLCERGIRIFPSFVLGLEGESKSSLRRSEKHLGDLLECGLIDVAAVSIFMPLPGSPSHMKLSHVPELSKLLATQDDVPLALLQKEWVERFCSANLADLIETRERMLRMVPVGSGFGAAPAKAVATEKGAIDSILAFSAVGQAP